MNYFLLLTIIVAAALVFLPSPLKRKRAPIIPGPVVEEPASRLRFEIPIETTAEISDRAEAEVHA